MKEKINGILKLPKEKMSEFEIFIKSYSFFLSKSNEQYKYNESYLVNHFKKFKEFHLLLSEKKEIVDSIIYKIEKKWGKEKLDDISILFDNLWLYKKGELKTEDNEIINVNSNRKEFFVEFKYKEKEFCEYKKLNKCKDEIFKELEKIIERVIEINGKQN